MGKADTQMDKGSVMFETDDTLKVGKKHSDVNDLPLPALKNNILPSFFFSWGKLADNRIFFKNGDTLGSIKLAVK